jgi:hypothetical protein
MLFSPLFADITMLKNIKLYAALKKFVGLKIFVFDAGRTAVRYLRGREKNMLFLQMATQLKDI